MTPDSLRDLVKAATPGPWGIGHSAFSDCDVHSGDELVAKAWPGTGGESETDNASLIALAPEGLLLLADMAEWIGDEETALSWAEHEAKSSGLLARFAALGKENE